MSPERITIGGRTFEAENLDKAIFPKKGITQGDLLDYYRRIADAILPHLQGRPLTMQRFPNGIDEQGFYQKVAPDYFPEWIRRASVQLKGEDRTQDQVVCDDEATLAYLVDQGCIALHVWESRADKLDHPDRLVFDLDPPDHGFELVRQGAQALRDTLDEMGLVPFAMTTGSRGIHVVTPLDRSASFDKARAFARDLAELVATRSPDRFTTEMRKADRGERLFVDYLRNAYGQTSVASYAVRAREGAPVATPLDWDELQDGSLHAQSYTVKNIFRRLGQKRDPWRDMMQDARSLTGPRERLDDAMSAT